MPDSTLVAESVGGLGRVNGLDGLDSLGRMDSLGRLGGFVADSLASDTIALDSYTETSVSADSLFGTQTQLLAQSVSVSVDEIGQSQLTDNLVYQGFLVVLLCVFLYVTYMYRELLELLVKVFSRKSFMGQLYRDRSNLFIIFMRRMTLVGLLLAALLAVRATEAFAPEVAESLERPGLMTLGALVVVSLVCLYRMIMIKTIAFVGADSAFFREHSYIHNICWVAWTIVMAPIFLFAGSFYGSVGEIAIRSMGLVSIFGALVYLYSSYLFFLGQKVSNLQWILYLCAVDIFPVSLMVAMWKT